MPAPKDTRTLSKKQFTYGLFLDLAWQFKSIHIFGFPSKARVINMSVDYYVCGAIVITILARLLQQHGRLRL